MSLLPAGKVYMLAALRAIEAEIELTRRAVVHSTVRTVLAFVARPAAEVRVRLESENQVVLVVILRVR